MHGVVASPDHERRSLSVQFLPFSYAFFALAIVCDRYLVVSLETLCVRWNIREDVAGASFMVSAAHDVTHTPSRVRSQLWERQHPLVSFPPTSPHLLRPPHRPIGSASAD